MREAILGRRECLGGLLGVPAALGFASAGKSVSLANEAIEFRLAVRDGQVVSRRLVNRLANETVELPEEDFGLESSGGAVAPASAFQVEVSRQGANDLELFYGGEKGAPAGLEVRVHYELAAGKAYLRKRISVRSESGLARRLLRAELENWQGVGRDWRSMGAVDRLPYGSHPIYCDTLWAGVEFVAAFNRYDHNGFVLGSRPGGRVVGGDWVPLNATVVGVAEPLGVRDAFLAYIDDIRLAPPRLVACYNTWWTYYAKNLRGENLLALVRELKEELYDKHGVFFDIVTTDEGWADRQSIWQIDTAKLPRGFADVREVVESAGGELGLWISPSAVYPNSTDYEWARRNGYAVNEYDYRPPRRHPGLSLGDPRYREEIKRRLRELIVENNLHQIKYDGLIGCESKGHDDLLGGADSVEPLARHSFELLEVSREANPRLITEPTYLNSGSNYISPWIIQHADSVWGNAGGDCPRGFTPAPDYREAHTTARDYYIFASMDEVWLPQNALQYFDIVHADADDGFPNHAAMAFGRGRFFVPTYVNPKYMSELDWRIYAGLLRWARKNRQILRNTRITPSHVELGEPYVYSHWQGSRGIVVVRNPSNETKDFEMDLAKEGAPPNLSDAICYTQYPYRKGIASGLESDARISLKLAPWELLFLEIVPRERLTDPVAIGARWWRASDGEMLVAGEPNLDKVRVYLAGGGERTVGVSPRPESTVSGEVTARSIRRLPEAEWLKREGKPVPTVRFETECAVTIPAGASRGQVLLLLRFPGGRHQPNVCRVTVNGQLAALRESSSAGRVGSASVSAAWLRGSQPYLCEWSWHICDLEPGTSRVEFAGAAADPDCEIGLWAWAEEEVRARATRAGCECPEPQMPQYRDRQERRGVVMLG